MQTEVSWKKRKEIHSMQVYWMNFLASQPFQSNHASHNLIGLLQYNIEFTKLRKKSRYLIIEIFSYKYNETNHYFFLFLNSNLLDKNEAICMYQWSSILLCLDLEEAKMNLCTCNRAQSKRIFYFLKATTAPGIAEKGSLSSFVSTFIKKTPICCAQLYTKRHVCIFSNYKGNIIQSKTTM
jgi:hypothetical protein